MPSSELQKSERNGPSAITLPLYYFYDWVRYTPGQVCFVLALILYLLFESSFHSVLTHTVINPESTVDDIHRVEIYGRLISGFGSGLLLTSFLKRKYISFFSRWWVVGTTFILVFCTVYFGQKYIIERYLIEPSSAVERRDAVLVNTVKVGFYNQDLTSQELIMSAENDADIESKVMLSLISAGFLYSSEFKQSALEQLDGILHVIAWNAFSESYTTDVKPKFDEAKAEIRDAFEQYKKAHRDRDARVQKRRLQSEWIKAYDSAARQYVEKDILHQVESQGYSLRNNRVKRWYYENINKSMNELRAFRKNSKFKLTRGSAKRFIKDAKNPNSSVNRAFRKELQAPKGSRLTLYPMTPTLPWFANAVYLNFNDKLDSQLRKHGIRNMQANIVRFTDFEQHKDVVKKAKDGLGDYYVESFSFNWTDRDFYLATRDIFIEKEVVRLKDDITSDLGRFEDGNDYAEKGKNALRAILIPCIALILSVLLSIISVTKLSGMFLYGVISAGMTKRTKPGVWVKPTKLLKLKPYVFLFVTVLVLLSPLVLGWADEVKPLLHDASVVKRNALSSLNGLLHSYGLPLLVVPIFLAYGYISWRAWGALRQRTSTLNHKSKNFVLFMTILVWCAASYGIFQLSQKKAVQTEAVQTASSGGYAWLLSLQPLVFNQGDKLNSLAELPSLVHSITGPLKSVDANFWPELETDT